MTPLVDVVMVILIFLMLTGSFGVGGPFLPSSMPIKSTGKGKIDPDKIPKVPDPQLDIFVTSRDSTVCTSRGWRTACKRQRDGAERQDAGAGADGEASGAPGGREVGGTRCRVVINRG